MKEESKTKGVSSEKRGMRRARIVDRMWRDAGGPSEG